MISCKNQECVRFVANDMVEHCCFRCEQIHRGAIREQEGKTPARCTDPNHTEFCNSSYVQYLRMRKGLC
ncbi:MAG: hypothetical protein WBV94_21790 [Blastocatellia bacterium]